MFVRLTGCPLRCQYCDTEYAFHSGEWFDLDAILRKVRELGAKYICVTGGEPLAQPNCLKLLERLCDAGFAVSLETSGALDVAAVDARVSRVIDVKTPGSNEAARNRIENFAHLSQRDHLKFVICSRADYDWSKAFLREHALDGALPHSFFAELPSARADACWRTGFWRIAYRYVFRCSFTRCCGAMCRASDA